MKKTETAGKNIYKAETSMRIKAKNDKTILLINDHSTYKGGADNFFFFEKQVYESVGFRVVTFSHEIQKVNCFKEDDIVHQESNSLAVRKAGKFVFNPSACRKLKQVLRKYNPSFVKLQLVTKYPSSIYSSIRGYNVLQTLHGPNLFCATGWGSLKNSDECVCGIGYRCYKNGCVPFYELPLHILNYHINMYLSKSAVKLFVSPTNHLMRTAYNLGFKNIRMIPLCVDEEFLRTPVRLKPHSDPTILFVGNMSPQKGVHILLNAFAIILHKLPNAKLILAGRTKKQYLDLAKSLGISHRTKFLGFVDHKRIISQYQEANLLAMPSIWKEQFGVSGVEALACGVPCVGTNMGGIPEWLLDGKHGFLVPPGDSEALAEKIIMLLSNQELMHKFGRQGRNFVVKNFNPDIFRKNTLALLEEFS